MKIEHLLSDSTVIEARRRGRATRTATRNAGQSSTIAAPQAAAANPVTTTSQAGTVTSPAPVNLTATPQASNVPATAAPANGQDSGWERVKRFGSQAADALGSVGRGVGNVAKTVGRTVGDVATAAGDAATGVGNLAGGVGNLASRAVGGVAQTVGAVPGGLKAGYRGQSYKTNGPDYGSSNSAHQWGDNGAGGGVNNAVPDEVNDLRSTIRSMDQRLRRAGI
jgi:hypothetical protein